MTKFVKLLFLTSLLSMLYPVVVSLWKNRRYQQSEETLNALSFLGSNSPEEQFDLLGAVKHDGCIDLRKAR